MSLFCKNPFFDYLFAGLLTAVLIYLFYRLEEKFKPLPQDCIKMPCPIVYYNSENNTLYSLPYLDLLRTDKVWGFEIADIVIYKDELSPGGWEKAKINIKAASTKKISLRLPDYAEMMIIGCNMSKITKVIRMLKKNGIQADEFTFGKYWYVDVSLSGKTVPKVIYPRAGSIFKIFASRYKPKDLKEVFFVRAVKQLQ